MEIEQVVPETGADHGRQSPQISVIIPALNEADAIAAAIAGCADPCVREVIVVDGGSQDQTVDLALAAGAKVVAAPPGRGLQMNRGAEHAGGGILAFLHADTELPVGFGLEMKRILSLRRTALGAFTLRIQGSSRSLRIIERVAGLRARRLGLPYGDQVYFLNAALFHQVGGFPEYPIMEDFALARTLAKLGRIRISPLPALTSARRWERAGPWRTTIANQMAVAGFLLRVPPERLAAWYRSFTRG